MVRRFATLTPSQAHRQSAVRHVPQAMSNLQIVLDLKILLYINFGMLYANILLLLGWIDAIVIVGIACIFELAAIL